MGDKEHLAFKLFRLINLSVSLLADLARSSRFMFLDIILVGDI